VEGTALPHSLIVLRSLQPLLSSMAFWLLASLLVGSVANQLPPSWLQDPAIPGPGPRGSQAKAPQVDRRVDPVGIRTWKRWIPDAGGVLPGGVRKATLVRRNRTALERLVQETRRAELVHWALLPAGLLTALWLPPSGVLVNLLFALAFNLPCLLLQRFNRGRLRRCLARLGAQLPHA
jgi:glycosyl-4,4'-diaponeurosporenoate acyltransferase